jgi:hypothetical protein
MKNKIVTILMLCLTLMAVMNAYGRPPGARGGARGVSGGRMMSDGHVDSTRPNFGGEFGEHVIRDEPRTISTSTSAVGGELRRGVESSINALPAPRLAKPVSTPRAQFASDNRPFTTGWYADHPGAWQATHPNADAWAVATLASTTAWLGLNAAQSNAYATYYAETPPEVVSQEAAALAGNGSQSALPDAEWLTLGTYTLAPKGQSTASVLLTLSVDKDGLIRGNYLDVLSNSVQPIEGAIDKRTRMAAWRIGSAGPVTFQTSLTDLTAATTPVSLQFENGKNVLWSMVRQEK